MGRYRWSNSGDHIGLIQDASTLKDIISWSENFDINLKPWLILGKGPSFEHVGEVDLGQYSVCTLNHVIREVPADLAHIIDIDVVVDCADAIERNARCLVLPYYPHVNCDPTQKSIHDFVQEIEVLAQLQEEGRLIWYNLSSGKKKMDSPVIRAQFFSAEAALNILATCGVRQVRSLGVDGGSQYSTRFGDLSEKTLLANGHDSFDKQFLGIAKTIRQSKIFYAPLNTPAPVKVFVGTDAAQMIGVKVLEYSIKKYASISVEVQPIDDSRIPVPKDPANRSRTGFSFSRYAIPGLCGYKGRGIYMDADMLVFDDILKLWNTPFEGAQVLYSELKGNGKRVPQYSVMLLDCENLDWKVDDIIEGLNEKRYDYKALMQQLCILPDSGKRAGLTGEWNSLEHYEEGTTRLIHYTDMPTQPWVSNCNPNGELWYAALREAVEEGAITMDFLYSEIEKGHASPMLLKWAGISDGKQISHWLKRWFWQPPYTRFTKAKRPQHGILSRLGIKA